MSRINSNACTQQQSSERSQQLLPNWGTSIPTPFLPPWLQPPHEMPSPLLIPMSMDLGYKDNVEIDVPQYSIRL